jgi:glycosyltransferase involved in cell wall biosynthesis
MAETDLLIVPSIWFETFGFIVAEALSYGVPVLCSDTVGAQILVSPEMVYHGKTGLYEKLKEILNDPGLLEKENARILAGSALESVESHAKKIIDLYKSC